MLYLNSLDWLHIVRNHEFKKIEEFLPKEKNNSVLEIGSGTGFMFKKLKRKFDFVNGLEVEGSSYIFKDKDIKFYDGKNIPYKDNSFDIIISSHVLEHVNDIDYFLHETRRVLKNNGFSIHIIPSPSWRILTSFFHYFALFSFFLNLFFKNGRKSLKQKSKSKSIKEKLKFLIFSPRHGERGNVLTEVFYFSKIYWKKQFKKQNFLVSKINGSKIVYWGNDFLRNFMSLKIRKLLSYFIGSTSNIYIIIKK